MKLITIEAGRTYEISGQDLLNIIAETVKQTLKEIEAAPSPALNKWAGKHKLTTEEAAEYLGITKGTLYIFHSKYKMTYEKSRPCRYEISELNRVERARRVKPH